MPAVNTKEVQRRTVRFECIDDLLAEVDRIESADAAGRVRPLGNWSPGQNLQHLARFMTCSLDGFPGKMPLPMRMFGKALRLVMGRKLLEKPPPPGIRLPVGTVFLPEDDVSVADGAAALREQVARVQAGAAFIPASPLLGRFTREQWITLHLRHAELHLGFVGIDDAAS